jgi:4-aminobutyrate aminotransferase-like enzyme
VGATIATDDVARTFTGSSLSTFGGNPVGMAATQATLEVMERENVPQRAEERGRQLREALEAMKDKFPFIGDVRGMGLMQAVELVEDRKSKEPSPQKALRFMEASKRAGILVGKGGLYGNVLRIAPPMLIGRSEIAEGAARIEKAFDEVKFHD